VHEKPVLPYKATVLMQEPFVKFTDINHKLPKHIKHIKIKLTRKSYMENANDVSQNLQQCKNVFIRHTWNPNSKLLCGILLKQLKCVTDHKQRTANPCSTKATYSLKPIGDILWHTCLDTPVHLLLRTLLKSKCMYNTVRNRKVYCQHLFCCN